MENDDEFMTNFGRKTTKTQEMALISRVFSCLVIIFFCIKKI